MIGLMEHLPQTVCIPYIGRSVYKWMFIYMWSRNDTLDLPGIRQSQRALYTARR